MAEGQPIISDVHFEQSTDRLKVVMPNKRNWPYLILYTTLALSWAVMMIWGIIFMIQILWSGQSYRFVFAIIISILLLILFRFGKFLLRQWAYYMSSREILFLNSEELIVRRPVSIWGNTDVYGMEHITHFYEAPNPPALAFDYGYRHIYIGEALTTEARRSLRRHLNQTYFPDHKEESV